MNCRSPANSNLEFAQYIKWDKKRLIYRIKALEAYTHSLEKAFRAPAAEYPALVYMDKEKEELIRSMFSL